MAIRRPPVGHRIPDRPNKADQQYRRGDRRDRRRAHRKKQHCNRELSHRQQHPNDTRQPLGHTKSQHRLTRTLEVSQLRETGDQKHTRKDDPNHEQRNRHPAAILRRRRGQVQHSGLGDHGTPRERCRPIALADVARRVTSASSWLAPPSADRQPATITASSITGAEASPSHRSTQRAAIRRPEPGRASRRAP